MLFVKQGMLSGVGYYYYYIIGLVVKHKGPVYYTAFNPLPAVIVAVLASIVLAEKIFTGRYVFM